MTRFEASKCILPFSVLAHVSSDVLLVQKKFIGLRLAATFPNTSDDRERKQLGEKLDWICREWLRRQEKKQAAIEVSGSTIEEENSKWV